MRGDVLHDVVVLELSRALLLQEDLLLVRQPPRPEGPVHLPRPPHGLPQQVVDQPDDLAVAVSRLRVGEGGQGRGGLEAGSLGLHLGRLSTLRLGELGGDDDQAEVDHEEGADLEKEVVFNCSEL